jgi:N-formylglutamate deformylase
MSPPDAAFELSLPFGERLPIVVDSPHSGAHYPADFDSVMPATRLRGAEDAFVDRLWSAAPSHGAGLLAARFARLYIDPNRGLEDIDPLLLDRPWPLPLQPGPKSRLGIGLVWRLLDGEPLYAHRLTPQQVQSRIDSCWRPYHATLQDLLDGAWAGHGRRWHLNVHSMPDDSHRRVGLGEAPLADFVLGDLDGRTADEATLQVLEGCLRAHGFSVARNDPFKGVEIIRRSGDPARGCHAVQVEVKKSLYMDEATHRPHHGFMRVRAAIDAVLAALAQHVRDVLAESQPG